MNKLKYLAIGMLIGAFALPFQWIGEPVQLAIGQTVTVDSTQSPIVVNALADLADLTPTDGQSVIIKTGTEKGLWYYDKDSAAVVDSVAVLTGPGSVGRFLVITNDIGSIAAATAITAADIDNDVDIEFGVFDADSPRSLTLAELKKTGVQVVNVKQYGAVGDGVADDAAAIQAAIVAASALATNNLPAVYFPPGTYLVGTALTMTTSGAHFKLYSDHQRSATLKTKSASGVTTLLTVGAVSGVHSRIFIEGLRFDCNSVSETAIDATYARYTTIEKCEFTGMTSGDFAVKMGRWVNRFVNNEISGDISGTPTGCGLYVPNDSVNNFIVSGNSFTDCNIGIQLAACVNDMQITENTFDNCEQAGIYVVVGCRNLIIRGNYFEECGNTTASNGVALTHVNAAAAPDWSAPIVAQWSSGGSTFIENLVVTENEFASCVDTGLAIISGVAGLRWQGNHVYANTTYDYCVRLVEYASAESGDGGAKPRGILIEQSDHHGSFTELVQFLSDYERTDRSGLQIIWNRGASGLGGGIGPRELPISDLTSALWTVAAGTVTDVGYYENTMPIYQFSTDADISLEITFDTTIATMRQKYWRIGYLTKGASTNGVKMTVSINTGGGYAAIHNDAQAGGNDWHCEGINMAFYVPSNATQLKVRLQPVNGSSTPQVTNFFLEQASQPNR